MRTAESLSHTRWECKYHLVWIPKCRRKTLYGQLRKRLGEVLHDLSYQKESRILEGHLQTDHVHMLVSIPPKYSAALVVGFIKGKSAIHTARTYLGRRRNYHGMHFWARGYNVSTVGADEESVRDYIKKQKMEVARLDQLQLFDDE
jgi:putative transposase